jgi:hypothetical protein
VLVNVGVAVAAGVFVGVVVEVTFRVWVLVGITRRWVKSCSVTIGCVAVVITGIAVRVGFTIMGKAVGTIAITIATIVATIRIMAKIT